MIRPRCFRTCPPFQPEPNTKLSREVLRFKGGFSCSRKAREGYSPLGQKTSARPASCLLFRLSQSSMTHLVARRHGKAGRLYPALFIIGLQSARGGQYGFRGPSSCDPDTRIARAGIEERDHVRTRLRNRERFRRFPASVSDIGLIDVVFPFEILGQREINRLSQVVRELERDELLFGTRSDLDTALTAPESEALADTEYLHPAWTCLCGLEHARLRLLLLLFGRVGGGHAESGYRYRSYCNEDSQLSHLLPPNAEFPSARAGLARRRNT